MAYRRTNLMIMLGWLGSIPVLLAVPWLQTHLGWLYPSCLLEQLRGRTCPMCGLTTGLRAILKAQPGALTSHPLALTFMVCGLAELIARALLLARRLTPEQTQYAIRVDLRLHAGLIVCYLVYCVIFFAF